MKINGSAAKTSYFYKKTKQYFPNWKLIYKFKCTSTEHLLDEYLKFNEGPTDEELKEIEKEEMAENILPFPRVDKSKLH